MEMFVLCFDCKEQLPAHRFGCSPSGGAVCAVCGARFGCNVIKHDRDLVYSVVRFHFKQHHPEYVARFSHIDRMLYRLWVYFTEDCGFDLPSEDDDE